MCAFDVRKAYEEKRKKEEEEKKGTTSSSSASFDVAKRYEQYKYYDSLDTSGVNDEYINTFISDANNFFGGAEKTYNGMNWGNASSVYDSTNNTWQELKKRKDVLDAWLYQNKSRLTEDSYKNLSETLSSIDSSASSILGGFENAKNFYGQFETEDSYNQWKVEEEKKKELMESEDFKSKSGYVSTKADTFWDRIWSQYGLGYEDLTYEYINDVDGMRSKIKNKASNYSMESIDPDGESSFDDKAYDFITDEEKSIYNYYYATQGKKKAQEYLDSIQDTLQKRKANRYVENIGDNAFLKVAFNALVGLDQWMSGVENLDNFILGAEGDPTSAIQYAGAEIKNNIDSAFWKGAWDLGVTVSNQLPSILVGSLTGGVGGLATMGASVLGNSYAEMRTLGYDEWQSRGYATLVTASELALQKVMGGFSSLGGEKSLSKTILKNIDLVDNALGRIALKWGVSMFSEGAEEAIQSVLEPIFQSIFTGKFEGIDWGEVAYSGLLGALSAGFIEPVGIIAKDIKAAKTGEAVKQAGGVDTLAKFGKDTNLISADSVAYKIANKVDETTGAYQIGRLFQEVGATLSEQNKVDIVNGLVERNFRKKDAQKLANQYEAFLNNEMKLTDEQVAVLEKLDPLSDVLRKNIIGRNTTVYQRTREYADILKPTESVSEPKGKAFIPLSNEELARRMENDSTYGEIAEKTAKESKFSHTDDGKTIRISTGEDVSIKEISSIKNGEVYVRLENGEEVSINDIDFSNDREGLMYEAVADMNPETARELIEGFSQGNNVEGKSISLEGYIRGFNEAYHYGSVGMPFAEMSRDGFSAELSDAQRKIAYNRGKVDSFTNVKADKAVVDKKVVSAKNAKTTKPVKKEGNVYFGKYANTAVLKETDTLRGVSVKAVRTLAKLVGNDIVFYESYVENGKRVYKDDNGKVHHAPNGMYDTETGVIMIDLNSGAKGEGLILRTVGHELTHFIRAWSPEKFKVFADFLFEKYSENRGDGLTIEKLISRQIKKAEDNGNELTYAEAYEEVVADFCEAMLTDTNAMEKIAELKAKDKGLFDKIKEFFANLVEKFKTLFKDYTPDSYEGNAFIKMSGIEGVMDNLATLWSEALVDAGEAYSEVRSALGKGSSIKVNDNGEFLLGKSADGKILYNERTWNEGGRQALEASLMAEGYSDSDIKAALAIMDAKHDLVEQLGKEFVEQDKINKATITTDLKTGKAVLSALVSNGDYPVNIDLLMVCKKRQAYQRVINRLCETGLINTATIDALAIAEINKILGKNGFETACLGCFVESRRIRIQEWAETICNEWNGIVDKLVGKGKAKAFNFAKETFVRELSNDEINKLADDLESAYDRDALHYGRTTVVKKMEQLLKEVPSLRKHLSVSDLITPQGRTNIKSISSELNSLIACRYGSNTPKIVQDFNPYNHELAMYGTVPKGYSSLREYLYAIGGARMQSFSDFIVENWFDYCQIVADLATRKLPMHTYTKEIVLAKLFGMTGIKVNMSLIPDIDKSLGEEYAGLTKNAKGEYELIWADKDRFKATGGKSYMQSINFADAIALQNDPRYSANVGTIAVGIGDRHIRMMLADPRIRMVIPYHSSGMNPIFANLVGTEYYKDYTNFQNTGVAYLLDSNGKKVSLKLTKTQVGNLTSGFEFNQHLQELGDARATAHAYIDWCADASQHTIEINGKTYNAVLTPKFNDFATEENYYKLLEDFNTYDSITEEPAPQGDVQQVYPEDFDSILKDELTAREKYRQKQEPKWEATMAEIESFLKKHTKADTVAYADEHGIKLSKKDRAGVKKQKTKNSDREVVPISDGDYAKVENHFGTTKNYNVAGYMLKNGKMLDFSGKHWGDDYSTFRQVDHRDIQEVLDGRGNNGVNAMIDMISNGNIRLTPETGGINLAVMPNESQLNQLRGYINHFRGEIVIDIDAVGGDTIHSWEYNRGTSSARILSDIKEYFEKGTIPQKQSSLNQFLYSDRVTDKETLDFLENQEHVTVYRAMQLIDGKLYPPMNAYTYDKDGKKVLVTPSEIGAWEQSVERPDLIDPKTGKFKLDKGKVDGGKKGTIVPAAYNPYIHTSLSMLNDQFTSAYTRSNLVVVKGVVPKSELTSGYKAQFAKDSVGETEWHSGVVSTQLPESRKVILSRWFKPVEVVDNDVVAQNIKKMLGNTGIEIPYNVVSPKLRRSLEKIGVPIGEGRGIRNLPSKNDVKYSDRDIAPTFYSQMGKVVDGMKQDKFAGNSVVSMLRGRGVKAEEIRWSGIATWLEGKKSVTKAELLEFIRGSQLQIGEKEIGGVDKPQLWDDFYRRMNDVIPYFSTEEIEEMCFDYDGDFSAEKFKEELEGYVDEVGISEYDFDDAIEYAEEMEKALNGSVTQWAKYKLDGGSNYREIVFTMPNSSYTNRAMQAHWGEDAEGVLAHARIQDFIVNGKKMLFIEEIQSDWHNEGKKRGYADERVEDYTLGEYRTQSNGYDIADVYDGNGNEVASVVKLKDSYHVDLRNGNYFGRFKTEKEVLSELKKRDNSDVPDAPFKDSYHEYVLKRLLRMAAEQGYDSIGWTPADIQSDRWSEDYAEGYRIEYDQDMPKFLKKYGRQWGAKVDKTTAPDGEDIWSMELTDSMKDSVLHEGQVLYSDRDNFAEDKYFKSMVAKWENLKQGSYVKVGVIGKNHPLCSIGMPEGTLRYDVDKLKKNMKDHGDYLNVKLLEAIPTIIADPIAISEYSQNNTVSVFGDIFIGRSPMMVGVTISKDRAGNDISKVRTYNARRDVGSLITDETVLYLNEDKKRTRKWFQACGIQVPLGEAKFGFIRSISQNTESVNENSNISENSQKFSDRDPDSVSNRSLLANALETAAQNEIERNKLQQYKEKIDLINSEEARLQELNGQIHDILFTKGARDNETLRKLQFEQRQTANRINTYDRQLLTLEASKPLKDVLEREKKLAYKKAEQKGKDALSAYREKTAKTTRELMTRYQESRAKATENRHMTDYRHKIKKVVGDLNQLLLRPTKDKHVKEGLRMAVAEALSAINMDTIGADERVAKYNELIAKTSDPDMIAELTATRDRIELQGENLKDKLTALQTAYEKIKNSTDPDLVNAYQEPVMNAIKNVVDVVGNTSLRDMNLTQLEAVYEMYKMVLHTVRTANKAFKAKKGETITQISEAVNDEIRKVGKEKFTRNPVIAYLRKVGWTLLKPFTAFRTIGSNTFTGLYNELRNGEDVYYTDVSEAKTFIQNMYEKHGFKSWDQKQPKTFTAKSGKTFTLTLEQMMSLYAYSRRWQAHDHIIEGGIVLEDSVIEKKNKLGLPVKYQVDTKSAFNISEETLQEICNSLTKEQRAFVEDMQTYLSEVMGAKGNEVSMELLGVKLFKEEFYFPLKSSKYYMGFKPEEAGEIKLKNPAFSKETVQHANNPVVLKNFTDVWATHVNDMSMYHSFVLPLEDFTRVYNYKTKTDALVETMSTEATIANAFGEGATQYIRNFLKSLNGGVRVDKVGLAEKAISLSKKGAVLASASVTIQQPSAMMRAMALINPIHFVTTTHKSINLVKHKRDWAELKTYAPIAGIKEMGGYDIGMGQGTVDWIKDQSTFREKVDDALGKAPAFMDEITWVSIWNAVKRETASKNKGMDVNSEGFLKKAGERFTEVITMTQVYDSVFSRSDIMRNSNPLAKMLTAFMAELSTTLNMLVDSFIQGKRTGKVGGFLKSTTVTTGAIVGSIVMNAALKSIITAMRDDDEDESYAEKYIGAFVGNATDDLNPLGYIPFVKDVVSIFKGYDVERMDMALFSDLKNAIDAFDSDSKTEYEKWSGLVGAVSAFFGVPVKNVERDIRGAYNTIKSFIEGEQTTGAGIKEAIQGALTGETTSNSQQLYDAILSGDQAHIDRVKGRFKDQDAIDSAIKTALRENDSRIREAAQARYDGDISGYKRIAQEIIAEGYFEQDIVVGAINAEINAIKREEAEGTTENSSEAEEDEVTSIYKGDDINDAFDNGDSALAKEIIQDLIDTKVANGMEEKKARSSVRSSMTSYWKPLYKEAYQNGDNEEMYRIRLILLESGLYGNANEVVKTVKSWLKD